MSVNLEQPGGARDVGLIEETKNAEPGVPPPPATLAGSIRRESTALNVGNNHPAPSPSRSPSIGSRSPSPGRRSGSRLPSMTAVQIDKERRQSASEKIEIFQERRKSRTNSINSIDGREENSSSRLQSSSRNSIVDVVEDKEGKPRISDKSRAKLVGRLGEQNYLAKKNSELEKKLDLLSALTQRHIQYEQEIAQQEV